MSDGKDPLVPQNFRLPQSMVARLEEYRVMLEGRHHPMKVGRSDVVRILLEEGLLQVLGQPKRKKVQRG